MIQGGISVHNFNISACCIFINIYSFEHKHHNKRVHYVTYNNNCVIGTEEYIVELWSMSALIEPV